MYCTLRVQEEVMREDRFSDCALQKGTPCINRLALNMSRRNVEFDLADSITLTGLASM